MFKDVYPVQWTGERAVVTLPEHIDVSNAGQVREELLTLINRGAVTLIADMTATLSCDRAGADAVARAHKRAVVSGTQLGLVVTAEIVSHVLTIEGVDRLVSIYPSLEAALARTPAEEGHRSEFDAAVITPAVLQELIDALADGLTLIDDKGTLALVNRTTNNMFGYEPGELTGRAAETLFTLAVIRDTTTACQRDDLIHLAQAAAAEQAHNGLKLLDSALSNLLKAGLSLQAATGLSDGVAAQHITEALSRLDDAIHEIHEIPYDVFAARTGQSAIHPSLDGLQ